MLCGETVFDAALLHDHSRGRALLSPNQLPKFAEQDAMPVMSLEQWDVVGFLLQGTVSPVNLMKNIN